MNLLLLEDTDFITDQQVKLTGRRFQHLSKVHRVSTGGTLRAGLIGGSTGTATVSQITKESVYLNVELTNAPPEPLPLTLIVALPRPKMLRRIFQTIATMGVKKLYLVNSWRVEKSYWQTPWLNQSAIREQLILGLEQGCDTTLPEVFIEKRFKPFVEDKLPGISANTRTLVAHPTGGIPCPTALNQETTLAVGPEGGFIDYEIDLLKQTGFHPVTLGSRILRVETAIPVLLAKLFS
jgi:RsmE family RNA methyltransferase